MTAHSPSTTSPSRSPTRNLLSKQQNNPVAKIWSLPDQKNDLASVGSKDYPYVITTYRLTEHHLSGVMSRYLPMLAELFESHFAEISLELAKELGIANGDKVTVSLAAGQDRGEGHGHQPAQAVQDRRQDGAPDRSAVALGMEGCRLTAREPG